MTVDLSTCPIPGAAGLQQVSGLGSSGVLLLGEAMGDAERVESRGFVESAPAGSVLERAIRRCGYRRDQFAIWNVVPTQPPNNYLEGAPYEAEAIRWGLGYLPDIILRYKPRCILALGNVALKALTGLSGVMEARGYPLPSPYGPVIGTLHPAFLRRGAMSYLSVLMHDLRFAVALAARRIYTQPVDFWSPVLWRQVSYDIPAVLPPANEPIVPPGYMCYPQLDDALAFAAAVEADPTRLVAYDIETPWSPKAGEEDSDDAEHIATHGDSILSIQFSLAPESGIFLPWRLPFIEVARRILASRNPKVGANNWRFDDPRLAAAGCPIAGTRHDIRWAWRHIQPDLAASLSFVSSFYAPGIAPWKHLAASHPQVYGIRDVDVLMRIV